MIPSSRNGQMDALSSILSGSPILEYLHKESSDIRGSEIWLKDGAQILSIQRTQVHTTHE